MKIANELSFDLSHLNLENGNEKEEKVDIDNRSVLQKNIYIF